MIEQITSLSSTELIDDGINTVLREVGEYTCADRSYVFENLMKIIQQPIHMNGAKKG